MIWGGRGRGVFPKRSSVDRSPFLSPLVIGETGFSLGFCFWGFFLSLPIGDSGWRLLLGMQGTVQDIEEQKGDSAQATLQLMSQRPYTVHLLLSIIFQSLFCLFGVLRPAFLFVKRRITGYTVLLQWEILASVLLTCGFLHPLQSHPLQCFFSLFSSWPQRHPHSSPNMWGSPTSGPSQLLLPLPRVISL